MKQYTINGTLFEYDETKTYYDFFLEQGQPRLVEVRWDKIFEALQSGQVTLEGFKEELVLLDRWIFDAPRKRFYRKMVLEGVNVLSGEYWFENVPEGEKIIDGLENSGILARKVIETFLPDLAAQCKENHPAKKHYISP